VVFETDGTTLANRLRFIGSGVLVLGLTGAYVFYRARAQSAAPTMDELLPGYSANRARQNAILMGSFVVWLLEGADTLKAPATQAVIIAIVSVVVALCCFRVAWLMDRPAEDAREPAGPNDR
jgi:hypothetical protein